MKILKALALIVAIFSIQQLSAQTCEKFGIGTDNPQSSLEVKGAAASSATSSLNITDSSGASMLFVRDDGAIGIGTSSPNASYKLDVAGTVNATTIKTNNLEIGGSYVTHPWIDLDGIIHYNSGVVGIGTSSPGTYKLVLKETSSSSGYGLRVLNANETKSVQLWVGTGGAVLDAEGSTSLHLRTGGTDRLFINSSGNIGIGTSAPSTLLHLRETGTPSIRIEDADDSRPGIITMNNSVFDIWSAGNGASLGEITFRTGSGSGTERMRVSGDGKLGIGTTSPGAKLDVRGSAIFNEDGGNNDFRIEGDTEANLFFADASTDRIGIGTNSPGVDLDVQGDMTIGNGSSLNLQTVKNYSINYVERGGTYSEIKARYVISSSGSNFGFRFQTMNDNDTWGDAFLIDTLQRMGIGTLAPSKKLHVNGDIQCATLHYTGLNNISDSLLKKDITGFNEGLSVIGKINTVKYQYRNVPGVVKDNDDHIGILAQELQRVAPYCVQVNKRELSGNEATAYPGQKRFLRTEEVLVDNLETGTTTTEQVDVYEIEYLSYDPSKLTFIMLNAIKQLEARVQELENQ